MNALTAFLAENSPNRPSDELHNNALSEVLLFRETNGRNIFTLQQLAIKCVIKNPQYFLADVDGVRNLHTLENLPWPVSKMLLSELQKDLLISDTEKRNLAMGLANNSCKYLDYRLFRNGSSIGSDMAFFQKLSFDSPNMKAIVVSHRVWQQFAEPGLCCIFKHVSMKFVGLQELLVDTRQYAMDGVNLQNGDLGCRTTPCQGMSIIRAICKHLPNLRALTVATPPLLEEDVQALSHMDKLVYFSLDILVAKPTREHRFKSSPDYVPFVHQVVQAAGKIPKLRKINFGVHANMYQVPYCEFVELYGRAFPDKKMILEQLWLRSTPNGRWPQNLSVEELYVIGENPELDWDQIMCIGGPLKKLELKYLVPEEQIYKLLNCFGSHLDSLIIIPAATQVPISIHNVLLACEDLKEFRMKSIAQYYQARQIQSSHFQNTHHFWLWHRQLSNPNECNAYVVELTKLYLKGSKIQLKKYVVSTSSSMEALIQILQENPSQTCLDTLEEIIFDVGLKPTLLLKYVVKIMLLLLKRSPFFKVAAIFDHNSKYYPQDWLCEFLQLVGISLNEVVRTQPEDDLQRDSSYESIAFQRYEYLQPDLESKSFTVNGDTVNIA